MKRSYNISIERQRIKNNKQIEQNVFNSVVTFRTYSKDKEQFLFEVLKHVRNDQNFNPILKINVSDKNSFLCQCVLFYNLEIFSLYLKILNTRKEIEDKEKSNNKNQKILSNKLEGYSRRYMKKVYQEKFVDL